MTQKYAWQKPDWGKFSYDKKSLEGYCNEFAHISGISIGVLKSLSDEEKEDIKIGFLSDEAITTSEIEGEILDRDSLQSSIKRYLGLKANISKNYPRENGIAQMMVDLYNNFQQPLSHNTLYSWHKMLMNGRTDLDAIGEYRFHDEPMQIISGRIDKPKVHYEAPPSKNMQAEMSKFIEFFNSSNEHSIIHAGIAHLYFELIHPFEDGNGRIGRALIEKSLAKSLGKPTLIAVSKTILSNKKAYYESLEQANKTNDIQNWLEYFCKMVIAAQQNSIASIEFILKKAKIFNKHKDTLNDRQVKMLNLIFKAGMNGFENGVSVKKYIKITNTSPATANRDLNDLVSKNIMIRKGELKATRYFLTA